MEVSNLADGEVPPSDVTQELSKSINAGSKSYHTHLNRLITSRLPLALPPHDATPSTYATGLLHFAPIYIAFEGLWARLIQTESSQELPLETVVVLSALVHLHVPKLSRSKRLIADLKILTRQSEEDLLPRLYDPGTEQLAAFIDHIEDVAGRKPHVLIAYAWVMYMALFNGGFWIRTQLQAARDSSWGLLAEATPDTDSKSMSERPDFALSFWHFDGNKDGLDLKDSFKTRLRDVDKMLSDEQRDDIVHEAKTIFRHCGLLVKELDAMLASRRTDRMRKRDAALSMVHYVLPLVLLFGIIIRWVSTSSWREIVSRKG